ncbi:Ion transport protein-domain-containing protein [Chlamydoabsidia padenii]|nr:Ion transport protein-domain-containing protein [Chlamydoabsidia padenii]
MDIAIALFLKQWRLHDLCDYYLFYLVILKSLETGWDLMLDVSGFLFFFLFMFAMLGLISFRGVFSRRCYYFPNGPTEEALMVNPPMFCSGYYQGNTLLGPLDYSTQTNMYPGRQGLICPRGQQCIAMPNTNPHNGYVNFDMIFAAFLNVYTFVSMELWTDMMYQTQDADSRLAALFYCLGVYIIGFILMFLLLAVITSAFARVRVTSDSSSAFTRKKTTSRRHHILQVLHPEGEEGDADYKSTTTTRRRQRQQVKPARQRLIRWKQYTVACVQSKVFFYFGGAMVCLDTLFMCLRSVYAGEYMLEFLDNVETAFTFLFAIEIVVRMMGAINWVRFWASYRNQFDLFLVIVTCVIQLPMIQDSGVYMYLTVFQILRMYRLFLCVPRLEKLLNAALGTGESVVNVVIFLLLCSALFAPMFMQMFGGDFVDIMEPNADRLRFDTFWQSFLALIMIYTSEKWTDTLYDGMQSQLNGGAVYAAVAICLYFAFARYIVAGLYVAVILENFDLDDDYIRRYQIKHFIREKLARQKGDVSVSYYQSILRFMFGTAPTTQTPLPSLKVSLLPMSLTAGLSKQDMADLLSLDQGTVINKDEDKDKKEQEQLPMRKRLVPKKLSRFVGNVLFPDMDDVHISKLNQGITNGGEEDYDLIVAEENRQARLADKKQTGMVKSLFLFSENNPIRRFCKRLVGSCRDGRSERQNVFNWFIMACVLVSILVVILDEPSTRKLEQQESGGGRYKTEIFELIDRVMGVIFVVEMVLRVIADGLVLPQRAYLRHAWNRLDFVVILLNFGTLFSDNDQLPRALGTVRSMRVLRLIRYFGGVRDVFIDLFHAFPLMMDAMLLTFLVMIPFSVYGVNIFGGRFWTCNDQGVLGRADCMNEFMLNAGDDDAPLLILAPRTWQNPVMNLYSFDDFGVALRHLFSLTSTEGWVDSMFYAMSTPPEPDLLPVFDWQSPMVYHSLFYVAFMIISHGTVQLFVGVIIEKFKQRSGITTLTFAQRQFVDLQRQLAELKPTIKVFRPTPESSRNKWSAMIRGWCYDLVGNRRQGLFNRWMMIVVVLNMVVIASEFHDEPIWLSKCQDYAYFAFAILYVLEVIIKFLGLGRKKWWQGKWNIYDACIAISSLGLVVTRLVAPQLWSLRAERYCLVLAAFRLGESIDALQTLYHTIAMAMPSIIRVSAVFMLVMCLFAMVFMEFFGLTKYGPNGSNNSNFRTYGNALLLLVRMTTGEGWNEVMMDYTFSAPNCVASSNYLETDCGSANWAYFLFNFFYITCTHIFLNLFIAVVISNFEYTYETRSRFTLITKDDLRKFKYAWAEVDPNGTGFIQKEQVAKFLRHLTGRFEISIYDSAYSLSNLQKLSQQGSNDNEKFDQQSVYYNYGRVNQCLSKMDPVTLEQRRKRYNLIYMEIIDAQTSKGIAFSDVLHIMAIRFVDIEQALTLHPLMDRLEKLDQFNKTYAAEKACGVFLTLIQRKRYLRQLDEKRHQLDTVTYISPVPTITIDNAPTYLSLIEANSLPASPLLPPPSHSLLLSYSPVPSSIIESTTTSPLGSPLPSPGPNASPWLHLDANASVSVDQAQRIMASLNDSPWSAMLFND